MWFFSVVPNFKQNSNFSIVCIAGNDGLYFALLRVATILQFYPSSRLRYENKINSGRPRK